MARPKRSKKLKVSKTSTAADENAELDALGPVAAYPEGRIAWWRARCAIIDRHRRRSRMSDPEKLQERHSPTVEIAVDDPEATRKARRNLTRARLSEAWRHNQLTSMQRDAQGEMDLARRADVCGMSAAVSKYSPLGVHGHGGADIAIEIAETWTAWQQQASMRGVAVGVMVDCLSEPLTLADIERAHRLKSGQAMACYVRGLDLWCELRGWIQRRAIQGDPPIKIRSWAAV